MSFSAFGVQKVGEFCPLKTAASVAFCLAFTRLEPLCQDFISIMLHKDELQRASADEIMVRVPTVPTNALVIPVVASLQDHQRESCCTALTA